MYLWAFHNLDGFIGLESQFLSMWGFSTNIGEVEVTIVGSPNIGEVGVTIVGSPIWWG